MAISNTPALDYRNVTHVYDGSTVAVNDLSLTIEQGETVCLLGPSGCGKTTALRIAAGLETPRNGEVWINGTKMTAPGVTVPPERRKIGLVFQDYALFPHLSVGENVCFGLNKMSSSERRDRAMGALELVGMSEYWDLFPHTLSGGQQQRIALARALAPGPDLILLDEPFSGLDARLRDQVRDNTLHALQKSGTAALMVTHDAEEAMYMADRIAVMREGGLIQLGKPEVLYCDPISPFVAAFFGEVNSFPASVDAGRVETPIGTFLTNDLLDGADVEVVVRPEALRLNPAPEHAMGPGYAKVLAARHLGRTSLVHLCTCKTTGEELHLHARVPGPYLPDENTIQAIELDRSQAFVFPT